MKRFRLLVYGLLTVFIVGVVGAGLVSLFVDLNRFKPLIAEAALSATGRELAIDGRIELSLFPQLRATATGIRLSNVPGGTEPDAISVAVATVQVAWLPLLTGTVDVRRFHASGVRILVESPADGGSSLTFQSQSGGGDGQPSSIPSLIDIRDVTTVLRDGDTDTTVDISRLTLRPQGVSGPTEITLAAVMNGERVAVAGRLGSLLALGGPDPFTVDLTADVARSSLSLRGVVTDLGAAPTFDLMLTARGPSLATLSRLSGIELPDSAPYELSSHLTGSLDAARAADIAFQAGTTRIQGEVSLDLVGDRPRLTARIVSPNLDLSTAPTSREQAAKQGNGAGFTLTEEALPFGFTRRFDADVAIQAQAVRALGLTLTDASIGLSTVGGLMEIEEFTATLPEGAMRASGRLDARTAEAVLAMTAEVGGLDVARVLDGFNIPGRSTQRAAAELELASRGVSPRGLVDNLTANLRLSDLEVTFEEAGRFILTDANARFDGQGQPIDLKARGIFRGETIDLTGRLDPLADYRPGAPYTFRVAAKGAGADAEIQADMRAAMVDGLALRVAIRGQSLADLSGLASRLMPAVGPYSVTGTLVFAEDAVTLRGAELRIAESDLRGDFAFSYGGERPKLTAELTSEIFDLALLGVRDDAGPIRAQVAEDAGAGGQAAAGADEQGILNDTPIDIGGLLAIDAEVGLAAVIVRSGEHILRDVRTTIRSDRNALRLDRFVARLDGETLQASGDIRQDADGLRVSLEAAVTGIDAAMFVEAMGLGDRIEVGDLNVSSTLSTAGRTTRSLFDNASGEIVAQKLRLAFKTDDIVAHEQIALEALRIATKGAGSPVTVDARGTLGREALEISASLAPLAELRKLEPVQLEASLSTPSTHVRVKGVAPDRRRPQDLDFTVSAEGLLVREIAYAAGLTLDPAGPWRISGALSTTQNMLDLKKLAIEVGQSDLAGAFRMEESEGLRRFSVRLESDHFELTDFVRVDEDDAEQEPPTEPASGSLFSPEPFDLASLRALNFDVSVRLKEFSGRRVSGQNFVLNATAVDGLLNLERGSALVNGEPVEMRATADVRGEKAAVEVSLSSGMVDAGDIAHELSGTASLGDVVKLPVEVGIDIAGTGGSAHELASTLTGTVNLTGGRGQIQQRSFRFLNQGLLRQLAPWAGEQSDRTQINCVVARFDVKDGVATSRAFLVDAEFLSVAGRGAVDLGRETLDLTLTPRPKEVRLLDVAVPVSVTGPIRTPTVLPTAGGTAKKVATTLGIFVNPLVLLVPVIEGVAAEKNPCVAAIERANSGEPDKDQNGVVGGVIRGIGEGVGDVGRGLGRIFGGRGE